MSYDNVWIMMLELWCMSYDNVWVMMFDDVRNIYISMNCSWYAWGNLWQYDENDDCIDGVNITDTEAIWILGTLSTSIIVN